MSEPITIEALERAGWKIESMGPAHVTVWVSRSACLGLWFNDADTKVRSLELYCSGGPTLRLKKPKTMRKVQRIVKLFRTPAPPVEAKRDW